MRLPELCTNEQLESSRFTLDRTLSQILPQTCHRNRTLQTSSRLFRCTQSTGTLIALFGALFLTLFSTSRADRRPEAILTLVRPPTRAELTARNSHAKYEPRAGCYLGAYIDFDGTLKPFYTDTSKTEHRDPGTFENFVNRAHAMYFFYLGYGKPLPLDWVTWLHTHNKFVHIALEPNNGLKAVKNDRYLQKLADDMARSHARIFLRFASEMNGKWTAYHGDPTKYREAFRLVHDVMAKRAPNVAMVWCPYFMPSEPIQEYYPGDQFVDWVGVNMYSVTYHNNSLRAPCSEEHPCDMLDTVYKRYAAIKPIMICEYGATHLAACDATPVPDFAIRKLSSLYNSLPAKYPRVKAINYFDSNTLQFAADLAYNDYSVTNDEHIRSAYNLAVSGSYFLDRPQPWPDNRAASPPVAMPIKDGDVLRGNVEIGCWARTPSDRLSVRYLIDNFVVYSADEPDRWTFFWPADKAAIGKHKLMLKILNSHGRTIAEQAHTVIVQH